MADANAKMGRASTSIKLTPAEPTASPVLSAPTSISDLMALVGGRNGGVEEFVSGPV